MIPSRRVDDEAASATERFVRAMAKTRDQTGAGKLLADTEMNYGAAGQAEVSHLMHQLARDNPVISAALQDGLAKSLPSKLHRALYARAMNGDVDDREGEETPPEKPTPGKAKPKTLKKPKPGKEGERNPEPDCTQEEIDHYKWQKKLTI